MSRPIILYTFFGVRELIAFKKPIWLRPSNHGILIRTTGGENMSPSTILFEIYTKIPQNVEINSSQTGSQGFLDSSQIFAQPWLAEMTVVLRRRCGQTFLDRISIHL